MNINAIIKTIFFVFPHGESFHPKIKQEGTKKFSPRSNKMDAYYVLFMDTAVLP